MESIAFSKWSAAGNTTVFFQKSLPSSVVGEALGGEALSAEQAGFVSLKQRRLDMAGGEFCVNATRSFAAWLAWQEGCGEFGAQVSVSGWPGPVRTWARKVGRACWQADAELDFPGLELARPDAGTLVALPGIVHLLVPWEADTSPEHARYIMRETGIDRHLACGVVWYRPDDGQDKHLIMKPVVRVRELDTLYAENACGSGTLALAIAARAGQGGTRFVVRQPSGECLEVRFADATSPTARVCGTVRLIGEGLWYPAQREGKQEI